MSKKESNATTMRKEMRHIMDHARTLVDATSGEVDERIKSAREALKNRLESASGEYGDLEDQILEKVKVADEFVHEKPYYAIGVTLIAGMFLGWLLSRK